VRGIENLQASSTSTDLWEVQYAFPFIHLLSAEEISNVNCSNMVISLMEKSISKDSHIIYDTKIKRMGDMTLFQNILHRAGTVLNINPQTPKRINKFYLKTSSDSEAIKRDFQNIGKNLWKVINEQKKS